MRGRPRATPSAFKETLPPGYKEGAGWKVAEPGDDKIRAKWWELYNDPQLNALEEQVAISNQTIAAAEANFRGARALVVSGAVGSVSDPRSRARVIRIRALRQPPARPEHLSQTYSTPFPCRSIFLTQSIFGTESEIPSQPILTRRRQARRMSRPRCSARRRNSPRSISNCGQWTRSARF